MRAHVGAPETDVPALNQGVQPAGSPRRVATAQRELLIVDDDRAVRESLRFLLAGPRFRVHVAPDAYAAAALLEQVEFDVVLTDLKMPGGGRSWVENLHHAHPHTRIIVLSAALLPPWEARALGESACAVLPKPIAADVLVEAVTGTAPPPLRSVSATAHAG